MSDELIRYLEEATGTVDMETRAYRDNVLKLCEIVKKSGSFSGWPIIRVRFEGMKPELPDLYLGPHPCIPRVGDHWCVEYKAHEVERVEHIGFIRSDFPQAEVYLRKQCDFPQSEIYHFRQRY